MKRIFLLLIIGIWSAHNLFVQTATMTADDISRICLSTYVPDDLPAHVQNVLQQRLEQVVLKNGLGGADNQRFVIAANIVELGKETTNTVPIMYIVDLSVGFVIGDGVQGTMFAATSTQVQGIGASEAKAYMDAVKKIKATDPIFKSFLNKGKERIVAYFTSNCDFILKQAQALAGQHQFDQALANLMQVPDVCQDCYNQSMNLAIDIYKRKIEHDCQTNINNAKVALASHDWETAAVCLLGYTEEMDCYPEANRLIGDLEQNMDSVSHVEWDFFLRHYQDSVDITKLYLQAIRDIGVAYGEHQQPVVYNTTAIRNWW